MPGNKAVAYLEPGKVEVQTIDYPELVLKDGPGVNPANVGRKAEHGVILKVVSTNICGSDQHMVRGRTTAPRNLVLGHEITGEVIGVGPGSTVYVAGGGPVGLACAHSAQFLGASVVIVGDVIDERLAQARSFGCETIDLKKDATLPEQIEQILGEPEVDAAVDCVGFEARGHGADSTHEAPATVLNSIMGVARAGASLGIPGLYVTGDPGGVDDAAKEGSLSIRIGLGWAKSHTFTTGQCPVMRYHRGLMNAILRDKVQIANAVNATVIPLDDAPEGYRDFDKGASKKFVLNPHGLVKA